jgi:hypothetical protein
MLEHPWLSMPDEYNYKMSEKEYKILDLKEQTYNQFTYDPDPNFLAE